MPEYDYRCKDCGHTFTRRQPITAEPLTQCPECGGSVRRAIGGGSGFILKGAEQHRERAKTADCSLERTGKTCCGSTEPCSKAPCSS